MTMEMIYVIILFVIALNAEEISHDEISTTNNAPSTTENMNPPPTMANTNPPSIRPNISRHKPENSFSETLKDIAYYLRAHKFNEYDRRYEKESISVPRDYYKHFPRPPLRALHWEVRQFCEANFTSCVDYLGTKLKLVALKRYDDTSYVIHEQKWHRKNDSEQIKQTDLECNKMKKIDDTMADPFAGPLERFQWRSTASYYMCWYTMLETPELEHIGEHCDNFAACLDPRFGSNNFDVRANDTQTFACALYSFCPDPCCPFKHLDRFEECWDDAENPCYKSNPPGQRNCLLNSSSNTEFHDIILNRWNVSCNCARKGYTWSSLYGFCIDIDECETSDIHNCSHKSQACLNLPGSYKCACKWGYVWSKKHYACVISAALELIKINRGLENENKTLSFFQRVLKFFGKSKSNIVYVNYFMIFMLILIVKFST